MKKSLSNEEISFFAKTALPFMKTTVYIPLRAKISHLSQYIIRKDTIN